VARRAPDADAELPALYAQVQPGLESVAADEITRDLQGEVKRTERGVVVFRLRAIDEDVLKLRTTEDIYLMAWGTNSLSFKAGDLETIKKWTAKKPDWPQLFRIHHAIRPKIKGKPTFHLVAQMTGEHGYRRVDALDAMADGLHGIIPVGWVPAEENAWLEIWMTINGKTAVSGLRLSDRTMRHRTYKTDHVAASLRPTVAAAMVRLAGIAPAMTVLDPMCGAGTILAEAIALCEQRRMRDVKYWGGDIDPNAIFCTQQNLGNRGENKIVRWDAMELPLSGESVDRIVCNPPFGKQLSSPELIPDLYMDCAKEWDRVLRPGGRAVLLAAEQDELRTAVKPFNWKATKEIKVRVLGQSAVLSVWQKPEGFGTMPPGADE
jgi:tRNA (guanine6-N2)-methyltransferase